MREQALLASKIPRLPRGVRLRHDRVRGRWVLLAPERIFELDDIGTEILRRCDGMTSVGELVDRLARAFEADRDAVRHDVEQFLQDFADKRVLDL
jgi:pyrroloquinoline quinone biosynthesis protein D